MKFTTQPPGAAIRTISETIVASLQLNKPVLWLTSGGSAINAQIAVLDQVRSATPDSMQFLTIIPVDERYGPLSHKDSNTEQMRQAGFDPGSASWIDVLANNQPMAETVSDYARLAQNAFAEADVVIATLGIGPDGHTAGLLPGSPALTDTVSTAIGYGWDDYERLTLGVPLLTKIDHAFVLAYGVHKQAALERLAQNSEPTESLPAKILYDIADVTVYNDYINT
ncbi:6-phosphogluconolactonase [Candidatus Saccharibacteria bacterium]|nr:6-phosphogluconolactonase [Candidatus Saccharibacteria bacterium]